jgi:hypothetical protein
MDIWVVLDGLSGTCLELFGSWLSMGMYECMPACIQRFSEFEILWA